MSEQAITYISLISEGLLTVFACAFFYILTYYTKFGKLKWIYRQLIIGVIFGLIAIFGTVFGINTGTAVANVRDAPVIAAGLIFGGPAGVIAAVIGSCHRAYVGYIQFVGYYATTACIISTLIAALYSWALRKWFFEKRTPNFIFGMATAMIMETLHLIVLYITRINYPLEVLEIIKSLGLQMIIANGVAVGLSCFVVNMLDKGIDIDRERKPISLNSKIQVWLLLVTLSMALTTFTFVNVMQNNYAYEIADETLSANLYDIRDYISRYVNGYDDPSSGEHVSGYADGIAYIIAQDYARDPGGMEKLQELQETYHVSEIHMVSLEDGDGYKKGDIIFSANPTFVGQNVLEDESEYTRWIYEAIDIGRETETVPFTERSYLKGGLMKYAGAKFPYSKENYYFEVGYSPDDLYSSNFGSMINDFTTNRRVYLTGFTIVFDANDVIVSNLSNLQKTHKINLNIKNLKTYEQYKRNNRLIYGDQSYFMYSECESYYLVTVIPTKDVTEGRDMMSIVFTFMLAIIFAVIFFIIYVLVKNMVIKQIRKINGTLSLIIDGDLEQKVDVNKSLEFSDLSHDINITVDTLKEYIAEAASRIDQELEFAKRIQTSSLPSAFPAFPTRTDFDVYATMKTAKQVGGDFYDFYFIDGHHIAFLVADVSGKGVPASMFMMESKTMIKNIATNEPRVNMILTKVNNMLCENNDANMFVTCWMGIIDLHTGEVKFANAGHNTPLICRKDKWEYITQKKDLVLGGLAGITYQEQTLTLKKGDKLYLYTDGVTEATRSDKELYGEKRLHTYLNKMKKSDLKGILEGVQKDIDKFIEEEDQFDDITMLVVEYKA